MKIDGRRATVLSINLRGRSINLNVGFQSIVLYFSELYEDTIDHFLKGFIKEKDSVYIEKINGQYKLNLVRK